MALIIRSVLLWSLSNWFTSFLNYSTPNNRALSLQELQEDLKGHLMCCADNMPPRVPFSQYCWLTFSLCSTINTDPFLLLLLESYFLALSHPVFVQMAVPNKYLASRKLSPAPKRNPGTAVQTQKIKTDSNIDSGFYTLGEVTAWDLVSRRMPFLQTREGTQCKVLWALAVLERTQLNSQQWKGTWNWSLYWELYYIK